MIKKSHHVPDCGLVLGDASLPDGVYLLNDERQPSIRIADAVRVFYATRDPNNQQWGKLLAWEDQEGEAHSIVVRSSSMFGPARNELLATLADGGLFISPLRAHVEIFLHYIGTAQPESPLLLRTTSKIGWLDDCFVLPHRVYGVSPSTEVIYSGPPILGYRISGTLEEWQHEISRFAPGNSRLTFALSIAFLGMLLRYMGMPSMGFHILASTSVGKSTILDAASSVCGDPVELTAKWATTNNALEWTCVTRNDGTLIIDELGQCDDAVIGGIAYMLAQGKGKERQARDGGNRETARWLIAYFSAGEENLTEKLSRVGLRAKGGQELRMTTIAGDAGRGMGVFEELHGFESPGALSNHLKQASARYYGSAQDAFLDALCQPESTVRDHSVLRDRLSVMVEFLHVPDGAAPDIQRTARHFAAVALAGEVATELGVTGWEPCTAQVAVKQLFSEWLESRTSPATPSDDLKLLRHIRRIIESDGGTRLPPVSSGTNDLVKYRDRLGFTRFADGRPAEFLFLREQFESVLLAGQPDKRRAMKVLIERGWMLTDQGRMTMKRTLPISPDPIRVHVLTPRVLLDDLS